MYCFSDQVEHLQGHKSYPSFCFGDMAPWTEAAPSGMKYKYMLYIERERKKKKNIYVSFIEV